MAVHERIMPQLMMKRSSLSNLGKVVLPLGYSLRHYKDSNDDLYWEQIISESFSQEYANGYFERSLKTHKSFKPERVLFICHNNGQPVATASAWFNPKYGTSTGQVHYVGVMPSHQGCRLGYYISLAVLHRLALEGFKYTVLETDDFRVAAIKTYLKLGFEPFLVHENQRERWKCLFREMPSNNNPYINYSSTLKGPIHKFDE
jgi:mycothiol synthase